MRVTQVGILWLALSALVAVLFSSALTTWSLTEEIAQYEKIENGVYVDAESRIMNDRQIDAAFKKMEVEQKRHRRGALTLMTVFEIISLAALIAYWQKKRMLLEIEEENKIRRQQVRIARSIPSLPYYLP